MTQEMLSVALVQMCSAATHRENIAELRNSMAMSGDAQLVALPEVAGLMNRDPKSLQESVTPKESDPFITACQAAASEFGKWVHIGSTPVLGKAKYLNHSALIDDKGSIVAEYDKIHLFDAIPEGRKPVGESKRFEAGTSAVLVDTPWGPWGLSICYDLRFPRLYLEYGVRKATVIFIPSAFTVPTGKAHWEVLLRARAIETGSWVVAAAQAGLHQNGRHTYGHSMIVDPWGEIVLELGGGGPAVGFARLDLELCNSARNRIPALENARNFGFQRVSRRPGRGVSG